jgi:hypothetical protein
LRFPGSSPEGRGFQIPVPEIGLGKKVGASFVIILGVADKLILNLTLCTKLVTMQYVKQKKDIIDAVFQVYLVLLCL